MTISNTQSDFLNLARWLAEQPVWAILMRTMGDTRIIDGGDARIIGGMNKRSREMILQNRFREPCASLSFLQSTQRTESHFD